MKTIQDKILGAVVPGGRGGMLWHWIFSCRQCWLLGVCDLSNTTEISHLKVLLVVRYRCFLRTRFQTFFLVCLTHKMVLILCLETSATTNSRCLISKIRLRWSRGSLLAFSAQYRRFKPGRSRRIFRAKNSSARLPSEGKKSRRSHVVHLRHVRDP